MPALDIVNLIYLLLSQFFRFVGHGGSWTGNWLVIVLDLLKKIEAWQGQIAIFLGLAGLIIAMTVLPAGARWARLPSA